MTLSQRAIGRIGKREEMKREKERKRNCKWEREGKNKLKGEGQEEKALPELLMTRER